MPRVLREGSELARLNIRPFEVPDDARHSGFRYTKWVGDFTGKDLRFVDIVDSDCRNIVLPWQVADLSSKRTLWRGAKVPSSLGSCDGDLLVETVRQNLPSLTGNARQFARIALAYVADRSTFVEDVDEDKSWHDMLAYIQSELGWTLRQVIDRGMPAFGGFPRVQRRLRVMGEVSFSSIRNAGQDPTAIPVIGTGEVVDISAALGGWYRWQVSRDIEALLGSDYKAHVHVIRPLYVVIIDISKVGGRTPSDNWFRRAETVR